MPWEELPAFIRELEQRPRRAARILHLLILTATRTNEVRYARPEEFDLDNRVWSIPGDRTKSGRPLRVPLCEQAVDIVRGALPRAKYGYLFPGCKEGWPGNRPERVYKAHTSSCRRRRPRTGVATSLKDTA